MFKLRISKKLFLFFIIFCPFLLFGCLVIGKMPHIKIGGISISDSETSECAPPKTITDKEYDISDPSEIDENAPTGLTLEQIKKYYDLYLGRE